MNIETLFLSKTNMTIEYLKQLPEILVEHKDWGVDTMNIVTSQPNQIKLVRRSNGDAAIVKAINQDVVNIVWDNWGIEYLHFKELSDNGVPSFSVKNTAKHVNYVQYFSDLKNSLPNKREINPKINCLLLATSAKDVKRPSDTRIEVFEKWNISDFTEQEIAEISIKQTEYQNIILTMYPIQHTLIATIQLAHFTNLDYVIIFNEKICFEKVPSEIKNHIYVERTNKKKQKNIFENNWDFIILSKELIQFITELYETPRYKDRTMIFDIFDYFLGPIG